MRPVVRFAPSPTGFIHVGNARTALINALFARVGGGRFLLRYDDTDRERSKPEFAGAIAVDLAWLGIVPDVVVRQSDRIAIYDEAATRLKAMGRLYPCYETAEELDRRRKRQQARGLPPVYDRAALALTDADRARLELEGRRPHWRFKLDGGEVRWTDGIRGDSRIESGSLSDPVLIREDGSYLYTLPSVVDDIALSVTHVIRGEDHVTNTAVQIQLFRALADTTPSFAHHNLLVSASGEGLSKRSGALSISGLRSEGIESLAVAAFAVLTGSSEAVRPVSGLDELATLFDLTHISRNPARFDPSDLAQLSARTLHALPFETVADRLAAFAMEGPRANDFWLATRGNIARFDDLAIWHHVVEGPLTPVIEDADFLRDAKDSLPPAPWDQETWSRWTQTIKTRTGRKGRALYHPLRLALTGRPSGPELAALLPLIGPVRTAGRLLGETV